MWVDEGEAVAPIISLYQIVDAQKEEVFFPDLRITLRSYDRRMDKCPLKWGIKLLIHSKRQRLHRWSLGMKVILSHTM